MRHDELCSRLLITFYNEDNEYYKATSVFPFFFKIVEIFIPAEVSTRVQNDCVESTSCKTYLQEGEKLHYLYKPDTG